MNQGFITTFRHVEYALGFIITNTAISDGLAIPQSIAKSESLAFSMRATKEIVHANIFNRAFSNSYPGGDGKAMCATDHPNKSGGTWRNELSSPSDLSEAALEQAYIDIADFRDDRGKRVAYQPMKLIIPPALEFEAARILKSILQADSANHNINAMRMLGKIPQGVSILHNLTDSDAWFLKTNCPRGLMSFNREDDNFDADNDFETRNARFAAFMRFSAGHGDPRGVFGSPGA